MNQHTGFDPREKHQSQIPALKLLVALGFTPLSQDEALRLRGGGCGTSFSTMCSPSK